ncbi:MAG: pyrroline-5-carboxylate reductase, partial [Atopobiaceae bacterium]|nr:pyrroline-5-carboxylate reductase [Atopobiaceae bacterium]
EMMAAPMLGTARTILEEGVHPRAYMERGTSPGGTTAAALEEMEPLVMDAAYAAVDAALERTRQLAEAARR